MSLSRGTLLMSVVAAAVTSAIPGRLLAAAPVIIGPGDSANRRFSLVYKGATIGRHVVRSAPMIEDVLVSTEIEVAVKSLFLTVFSYSHRRRGGGQGLSRRRQGGAVHRASRGVDLGLSVERRDPPAGGCDRTRTMAASSASACASSSTSTS